ncbi:MAG: energy-coupling factor transporter ATPase, partial [Lachnospiraceae bacterium]|nr:energy-coupling factor transporter ATPase [Lachnospiraceae bacterium]
KKLRQKVGLVFQYPEYQLFETSIFKDVCFGPKNMGLSEAECKDRAAKALTTVGLPESEWEKSPFDISGGEWRRAAIAGVFAMEPEVLVLDEPTAGLDPEGRRDIFAAIDKMREQTGAAVILVSHSMEDVAEHADRVVVMEDGRIAMDGPVREVFARREELEKMGLRAPEASYLMEKLRDAGLPVKTGIVTSKEAEEEILRLFGRQ